MHLPRYLPYGPTARVWEREPKKQRFEITALLKEL
jgi:hypothetical protein